MTASFEDKEEIKVEETVDPSLGQEPVQEDAMIGLESDESIRSAIAADNQNFPGKNLLEDPQEILSDITERKEAFASRLEDLVLNFKTNIVPEVLKTKFAFNPQIVLYSSVEGEDNNTEEVVARKERFREAVHELVTETDIGIFPVFTSSQGDEMAIEFLDIRYGYDLVEGTFQDSKHSVRFPIKQDEDKPEEAS